MACLNWTLLIILFLPGINGFTQSTPSSEVKQQIELFFEAFHAQDSTEIKKMVREDMVLQTMGFDKDGHSRFRTESFEQFLSGLMAIPDTLEYREELLEFNIQIDGPMAHVWTPYRFWIGDRLRHCGVNSFQLFNDGHQWHIIYLADTRRRQGCDQ
ncbi:MAG: nuclear transport factor 2 family protein [Flavobacteriaceae bacterium]